MDESQMICTGPGPSLGTGLPVTAMQVLMLFDSHVNRSASLRPVCFTAAALLCAAVFLHLTLPRVPWGPVIGTGQDEWYNVIRSLRALYQWLHPSYFIHPALYYELLASVFAIKAAVLKLIGALPAGVSFLDYYLAHEAAFSDLARATSLGCGALTIAAAVWLGTLLASPSAGVLVGLTVASLPLMRALATCIRVDALALATYVFGAALVVRWRQHPSPRRFWAAAAGIGLAASANYPGAMLLLLLAWFEWVRVDAGDRGHRVRRIAQACALAFAVFLVLNPYVLLDLRVFLRWFLFQAEVPLYKHPHAPDPSPWLYVDVLRAQGPVAMLACAAGALAACRPRSPCGALALFALAHIVGFSLMQTQYDRFVLPAITLLCSAGAVWLCTYMRTHVGSAGASLWALVAAVGVFWVTAERVALERPLDVEPNYRAEMFDWIAAHVPPSAKLVIESDTMPLLQTVYDPVDRGLRFQAALRQAFERRHPRLVHNVVKAQYIATVYNYDPALLDTGGEVYFLASSLNREFIAANSDLLAQPLRFYEALDARASLLHQTGGFREQLLLYTVAAPPAPPAPSL